MTTQTSRRLHGRGSSVMFIYGTRAFGGERSFPADSRRHRRKLLMYTEFRRMPDRHGVGSPGRHEGFLRRRWWPHDVRRAPILWSRCASS